MDLDGLADRMRNCRIIEGKEIMLVQIGSRRKYDLRGICIVQSFQSIHVIPHNRFQRLEESVVAPGSGQKHIPQ